MYQLQMKVFHIFLQYQANILFKLGSKSEVDIITRNLNNKYGDDYIFKAGPLGGSISITKK